MTFKKKKTVKPFEINPAILEARALKERFLRQGGFPAFVKHFWEYVDPRKVIWNWHMDILCQMLEALGRGVINRLLINIPPGHGKSIICSVLWPAWKWALDSTWSCIFASHDEDLALRDAVKARDLIKHEEYRRIFRPEWSLEAWTFNPSQDTKHLYKTSTEGMRYSTSVGGAITGFRGNAVCIDDPLDANKSVSDVKLREHLEFFGNIPSRINDIETSQWLVIMQRLCEGDLSDELIKRGDWVHLSLPAEFDPEDPCIIHFPDDDEELWRDPRTEKGEPLFPQIQPKKVLAALRTYMGDAKFEAQYNQKIVAPKGGIIQHSDAKWHTHNCLTVIRPKCLQIVMSGDLTFMKTEAKQRDVEERRAFNNLDIWGTDYRNFYLLDTARGRWQFAEFEAVFKELVKRWRIWTVLLEDAAVSAVVKELLDDCVGEIIEIPAIGSKEARFQVAARYWRLGRVWLPEEPWARDWFHEITRFGIAKYKDRADTMSQAINYYTMQGGVNMNTDGLEAVSVYGQDIKIQQHNPAGYMVREAA
jgi:predicted phage terminase large subunit-like protein